MVLKKVLGFATTTSFILLVMIAPTTTTAASLQQQEGNATIDEPNIPIGPADEGPDEPIPNNENGTDDNIVPECENRFDDDPNTDEIMICTTTIDDDNTPDTWINWVKAKDDFEDRYEVIEDGVTVNFATHHFKVDFQSDATDTGDGSHVDLRIDHGSYKAVASPVEFTIKKSGLHTLSLKGVDADGNEDPTPATFSFTIQKRGTYPPDDGNPETWINWVRTPAGKNIANGGSTTSKVVTVDFQSTATDTGKGSHVDLKIDNGRYKAVASPKTIPGLSVGKHTISLKGVDKYGNEDLTPAKWTFTVKKDKAGGGNPDTWINWVRATPKGVNIANGGSTSSSTVIVDFQGTVAGRGSHIDLKIDSGSYVPVASPRTITGLSEGTHTIYLKAVNQAGKADPTPAKWTFTVMVVDEPLTAEEPIGPANDTGGDGGAGDGGIINVKPPIAIEPIPENENDTDDNNDDSGGVSNTTASDNN
jgi:hypothetical protein